MKKKIANNKSHTTQTNKLLAVVSAINKELCVCTCFIVKLIKIINNNNQFNRELSFSPLEQPRRVEERGMWPEKRSMQLLQHSGWENSMRRGNFILTIN